MTLFDKYQWQQWQEKQRHWSIVRWIATCDWRYYRLSWSGKTAFITALVQQLEQAGFSARLPHWQVLQSGRLLGARRVPQRHHHIPSFPMRPGLQACMPIRAVARANTRRERDPSGITL